MKGAALLEDALQAILPGSAPADDKHATGDELIAINTTPFARREIAKVPMATARALAGAAIQASHDGQAYVLLENPKGEAVVAATSSAELNLAKIPAARGAVPLVRCGFARGLTGFLGASALGWRELCALERSARG